MNFLLRDSHRARFPVSHKAFCYCNTIFFTLTLHSNGVASAVFSRFVQLEIEGLHMGQRFHLAADHHLGLVQISIHQATHYLFLDSEKFNKNKTNDYNCIDLKRITYADQELFDKMHTFSALG